MKVAAYIRVSTDGQTGEDKYGLEAQEQQITSYCEAKGHEIIAWYRDEGESGAYERPGFDRIVYGEVTNPPFEAVVVAKSDRVARDINVYFYYKMLLRKKDVRLISIAEDFGQFGSFAPMLEAFTLCVAEMERANITKRTAAGRTIKAAGGKYAGGRAPFGYTVKDGNLVVSPQEAEIVRTVFRMKDAGRSMGVIAKALHDAGYKNRSGNDFSASNIQSVLKNRKTYEGYYRYGKDGKWVQGAHEPLL